MPARKHRPDKFGTLAHVPAEVHEHRKAAALAKHYGDDDNAAHYTWSAAQALVHYHRYTLGMVVRDFLHPFECEPEFVERQLAAVARMREAGVLDDTRTSKAHKGCTSCSWHVIDARTGDDLDGSSYATTVESWIGEHFTDTRVLVVPVEWPTY